MNKKRTRKAVDLLKTKREKSIEQEKKGKKKHKEGLFSFFVGPPVMVGGGRAPAPLPGAPMARGGPPPPGAPMARGGPPPPGGGPPPPPGGGRPPAPTPPGGDAAPMARGNSQKKMRKEKKETRQIKKGAEDRKIKTKNGLHHI